MERSDVKTKMCWNGGICVALSCCSYFYCSMGYLSNKWLLYNNTPGCQKVRRQGPHLEP